MLDMLVIRTLKRVANFQMTATWGSKNDNSEHNMLAKKKSKWNMNQNINQNENNY